MGGGPLRYHYISNLPNRPVFLTLLLLLMLLSLAAKQ